MPDGGEVGFEADTGCLGCNDGFRQRLGHLPFADIQLEPAGFHFGLLLVAQIGDKEEILFGDQADRVFAGEVGEVRQVRGMGQEQPAELQLAHGVADAFLARP